LSVLQQWVKNHPEKAVKAASFSALGIVTGSLYTAGDILNLLEPQ
jgi:folylpolyglutamate synthase/dihydropteroate synthase